MRKLSTRGVRDEGGFTLIELLVVILIIGILAAIAIPALLSQKSKAYDSSAKTLAQTAQTAMETYSTENGGSYSGATPAKLNEIEPSINTKSSGEAKLAYVSQGPPTISGTTITNPATSPAATEYTVTVIAQNTSDEFSVTRKANGEVEHKCFSATSGCTGHSTNSNTW
jgi:type IV pilus assembly protein PilA